MSEFEPGPLHEVEASRTAGRWTLAFHQFFPHAPSAVWRALTEPDELRTWAPYTANRNLAALGPASLIMIGGAEDVTLDCTVTTVEPEQLLEHGWGRDILRWTLRPSRGGTELTLEHTIDDRDQLAMMAAGWHLCLLVADARLAGRNQQPIRGEDALNFGWEDLRDSYQARLP